MEEFPAKKINGFPVLLAVLALLALAVYLVVLGAGPAANAWAVAGAVLFVLLLIVAFTGLTIVPPNHAQVVTYFGRYIGSIRTSGFWFVKPLSGQEQVSLQVRNFKSKTLKVNDAEGNPVEVAAVIVFRVVDTEKALLEVENYTDFVEIQSKTALRQIAAKYPYDLFGEDQGAISLRGDCEAIARELHDDLQTRLAVAGLEVIDARLTHLAYATEVANAMLQRQQASAILAAKQKIVDGAVGIAQLAVTQINAQAGVELSAYEKVAMINNLLVSIVSDKAAQPVINVDLRSLLPEIKETVRKAASDWDSGAAQSAGTDE